MFGFDRIEKRLQEAVFRTCSNALAHFDALPAPVAVIFSNGFVNAGGLGVAGTQPEALCKQAEVPGIGFGSQVTINGTGYRVVGAEPDGLGEVLFRLERT
ncbi:MAG: hypothetical protein LRY31_01110 [Burkholderiaceae bacterium]|nr:hypothetical protein [Burkholderiaceae bacterium]